VNLAPILGAVGNKNVDEMTLLTFVATASDADIPAQTLTFSLVGAPAGASITAAGVFTWTPSEAQGPGDYVFDVVVSDGALTDSETITVHVNEVNVAPVLDLIGSKTVDQGALLTFTATATDADIPAQTLTFSLVGAPAGASITAGGAFSWTPSAAGDYTFDVVVSDGSLTDSEPITVTVNAGGAGIPPVASFFSLKTYLDVSVDASASSDDGTIVSYAWSFGDGSSVMRTWSTGIYATHTYLAAGTYTITLTVTDDEGLTATTTGAVTVAGRPGPPGPPLTLEGMTYDAGLNTPVCYVLISDLRTGGRMITSSSGADNPYGVDGYYNVDLNNMPGGYVIGDVIEVRAVSFDGTLAGTVLVTLDGSPSYWVDVTVMPTGLALMQSATLAVAASSSRVLV
jgi:PKD repeat protein